jgi:hypothetical protein
MTLRPAVALALAAVTLTLVPRNARAEEEERLAVVVGANIGAPGDEPLRYAESDARRVRDLMVELGHVRPDRALLVERGGPEDVLRAITEVRGRAAEIERSGRRVTLFFYYSGHGNDEALHLPRGLLSLETLRRELATVPANVRLVVLDSCRTGGREKGVRRGPPFALAVAVAGPAGAVEIRAAADGEAAQESEELAGAVFTHFWLSALRGAGDVDGDGRVTLAEAYAYAYRRTLWRSGASAGLQHPTMTAELSGAGELVLTSPAVATATIEVPAGAERYLVFALPSAAVMGELPGEGGARLALPTGRYLVARHARRGASVSVVDLSWGGRRRLSDGDFRPVAREELIARGGEVDVRLVRLEPRVGFEHAWRSARPEGWMLGIAAARSLGTLDLEMAASFISGDAVTPAWSGEEHTVVVAPGVGHRWFLGPLTLSMGGAVELRISWQRLTRVESDRAAAAGFATEDHRRYAGFGPRVGLRASLPLGDRLSVAAGVWTTALVRRQASNSDEPRLALTPIADFLVGAAFTF